MQLHTLFHKKLLNKPALHTVTSLLLQSRTFWWYLLRYWLLRCCFTTWQWHHIAANDIALARQCTGTPRRARARVELLRQDTPNFLNHAVHVQELNCCVKTRQTFLTTPCTCKSWTAASRNAKLSCAQLWPPNSPDLSTVDYKIWAVMQHCVYHRQIHSVYELKRRLINAWCDLEQLIFDETMDQWRGRHQACVHAKGWHFEYSLWTDNVDFVHICYTQCDVFDCCIFNYEIMPATLANTFLFILQGSARIAWARDRFYICTIKRTVSSTYSRGVRLAGYSLTRPRQNWSGLDHKLFCVSRHRLIGRWVSTTSLCNLQVLSVTSGCF